MFQFTLKQRMEDMKQGIVRRRDGSITTKDDPERMVNETETYLEQCNNLDKDFQYRYGHYPPHTLDAVLT